MTNQTNYYSCYWFVGLNIIFNGNQGMGGEIKQTNKCTNYRQTNGSDFTHYERGQRSNGWWGEMIMKFFLFPVQVLQRIITKRIFLFVGYCGWRERRTKKRGGWKVSKTRQCFFFTVCGRIKKTWYKRKRILVKNRLLKKSGWNNVDAESIKHCYIQHDCVFVGRGFVHKNSRREESTYKLIKTKYSNNTIRCVLGILSL